jgi:hypothetical protein
MAFPPPRSGKGKGAFSVGGGVTPFDGGGGSGGTFSRQVLAAAAAVDSNVGRCKCKDTVKR